MMVAIRQTILSAEVIDHRTERMASIAASPTVSDGGSMTSTGCRACHRSDLSGGAGPSPGGIERLPAGVLKAWTEADFICAMERAAARR